MTAAEAELEHNLEYHRMTVAELEEAEGKFNAAMDTIENFKQMYSDKNDILRWNVLNSLQNEINRKIGKEEQ